MIIALGFALVAIYLLWEINHKLALLVSFMRPDA